MVAPKRAALAEANKRLEGANKKLTGIRGKVKELKDRVASLEESLMKVGSQPEQSRRRHRSETAYCIVL